MFCYDHGHPGGDEGVGHASEPAELVNQIEALQSQINKMRPALEALQAEYDVAKEAHPDGVDVPPAPAPTVNKKSPKKKAGLRKSSSILVRYADDAALTEPSHLTSSRICTRRRRSGPSGCSTAWRRHSSVYSQPSS